MLYILGLRQFFGRILGYGGNKKNNRGDTQNNKSGHEPKLNVEDVNKHVEAVNKHVMDKFRTRLLMCKYVIINCNRNER